MGGSLGFRNVSLFPVRKQQVLTQFFTTRHERKVGSPCPHGELVHQKSPAATNSSIAHEQKDVNEVDDRAPDVMPPCSLKFLSLRTEVDDQ